VIFENTISPENAIHKKDNGQHDSDRKYKSVEEGGEK